MSGHESSERTPTDLTPPPRGVAPGEFERVDVEIRPLGSTTVSFQRDEPPKLKRAFTLIPPDPNEPPRCHAERAKSGKVRCEFYKDHEEEYHFGRGQTGRWYSWPVTK